MAVNLKCNESSLGIKKYGFYRKPLRSDGLLVQVHHTVGGSTHPVRFLHCAFHGSEDILAVTDAKGNIFIINLKCNRFWSLPSDSDCTAIAFSTCNKKEVIIASSDCDIKLINFENGKESCSLKGHSMPPTQLSCGGNGGKMLLSSAACLFQRNGKPKVSSKSKREATGEAILWDLSTYTQAHCLNVQSELGIKQAIFMPGVSSDYILAMFEDDTICVWNTGSFDCVKVISPLASNKEHHHVKAIAFTRDGRTMVVGGKSHSLIAYSLDTWEAMKVVELPDEVCGVKCLQFLPQPFDGGSNHVLAMLSHDGHVHFLDLNSSTFIGYIRSERSQFYKFVCSSSGCYIACILLTGELNIYCGSKVLAGEMPVKLKVTTEKKTPNPSNAGSRIYHHENHSSLNERESVYYATSHKRKSSGLQKNTTKVKEQIKSELNHKRMQSLLRVHGAFPTRYRIIAWRTALLQLPCNQKAFAGLIARGLHPAFAHVEQKYPLDNQSELKHLKKLMSCLAHWSPLFSQVNYLPLFIYPFVKLFIHDILGCFEAVATIIINYCQHWFEFFPFPPINVLAAMENLLSHHDPDLLAFFVKNRVNTRMYAWPLLQVAFSEVLSNEEWLRLWDHILVNEPSFLLAAVPAYCIICRTALLKCRNMDDFKFFFRNQNPIDMEKFISKTYWICKNTPSEFHPRHHLHEFQPLPKGETYPVFSQYPKILVDANVEKLKRIQKDEETVISKELEMLKLLQKREEQKIIAENAVLKKKYLKELEKAYHCALKMEEEKVSRRYMELVNLRRNMHGTNLSGNFDRLGKEGDTKNSSSCSDGHPIAPQKQKRNKKYESIPSSAKILSEPPKGSHADQFCASWPLENELQDSRHQQSYEFGSLGGDEIPPMSLAQNDVREDIHFCEREPSESLGECHGWFSRENKCQRLLRKPKSKKTLCNASIISTETPESPLCSEVQDVNFSKKNEKKRWKISENTLQDNLGKRADVDGIFGRYDAIYKEEQEAIKRAMEARMKVVWGRNASPAHKARF
ncbi:TBC1 domain family member 31 [Hetaerina americana]|uniref:TBC1 domain family member 31 n=1 Tax=Hetaerina americana TaxID=62018 RepID=UPI003A7F2B9B